jgi:murein DD-endopeptidase MepM/ murein hydrolase activator NlpD
MVKVWAYAIAAFGSIVFLAFLFDSAVQAMDAVGAGTASPAAIGFSGSGGLSSVNFADFTKGGSGWAYMTQGYGRTPYSYLYIDGWHNGIDIGAQYGAPIYSADSGTVVATGNQDNYCPGKAFGKFVVVKDASQAVDLLYAHLGTINVTPGEVIAQNKTEIGSVGSTGLETGPHLHFSVFENAEFSMAPAHGCGPYPQGHDINPIPYLENQQ